MSKFEFETEYWEVKENNLGELVATTKRKYMERETDCKYGLLHFMFDSFDKDQYKDTILSTLNRKWITEDEKIDILCNLNLIENFFRNKFEGLISLKEAGKLFNKEESTLRRNISNGKFTEGTDVKKFGTTWVFDINALEREYGKIETK